MLPRTRPSDLSRKDKKGDAKTRKPKGSVEATKKDSTAAGGDAGEKKDGRRRSNSKAKGTGKAKKVKDVAKKSKPTAEGQKKKVTKGNS